MMMFGDDRGLTIDVEDGLYQPAAAATASVDEMWKFIGAIFVMITDQ